MLSIVCLWYELYEFNLPTLSALGRIESDIDCLERVFDLNVVYIISLFVILNASTFPNV